ncbi:MAG: DinB family protein [Planctomycetia bacterium]|nr:DinB family protein [Planctomycetia bacterium]
MVRSIGNIIADSLQLSLGYAERLLEGVGPGEFARFARVGGVVVESNHPAFIYGHLSLYAPRVLWQIDHPAPAKPDLFDLAFSKDATCVDDPDGCRYPPMQEIVDYFREGHRMLVGALRSTPDAVFEKPNPAAGPMAERFPTLGSVQVFYCGGHMMMHLGQMSAWRRMQGLGPA